MPSVPEPPATGRVFVVAHSHLDVQWRWTVADTVRDFLPKTVAEVAARAAEVPGLVMSIDGVFRLQLLRDHHPQLFAEVKRLVAAGHWHVAGPLWEATDCIVPSPESLIRHVALGQRFLDAELGVEPRHAFLPDCFGFPLSLPSVLALCGLHGFLTQKLKRGSQMRAAAGVPFPVGWWVGPDGARVLAVLEPGDYGDTLDRLVQQREDVRERLSFQQRLGGNGVVMLVGVGDTGGAPLVETLRQVERSVASAEPPSVQHLDAESAIATLATQEDLPSWSDELLLNLHGPGCYTSKVGMKRWNRLGERLAFAAEASALAATSHGLAPWPSAQLDLAWERLLWHQFHDDLTGTSTPDAYAVSWNDEAAASSLFAGIVHSRLERLAGQLDLSPPPEFPDGIPFVVFNDVPREREELVELVLESADAPGEVGAITAEGQPLLAQRLAREDGRFGLLVRVRCPALGLVVVWVVAGEATRPAAPALAHASSLDNGQLVARIDPRGDLASLHDCELGELLAAPAGFELLDHRSRKFPAWEIHRKTLEAQPRSRLHRRVSVRVVEPGPLRATLEVTRHGPGVKLSQRVSIEAGQRLLGNRVSVDWHAAGSLLKVSLPLAPKPPQALYDAGWGVARRGPNSTSLWEVPAREWAAVELNGTGVAVASPHRHGWDQPTPGHLRLTLAHSPRTGFGRRFRHQGWLDFGRWEAAWAVFGYAESWDRANVPARAEAWCRPLLAWRARPNSGGPFGRSISLLDAPPEVAVMAVGRETRGGRPFVRVVERSGQARVVDLESSLLRGPFEPIDGCDRPLDGSSHPAARSLDNGGLRIELEAFAARSLAAHEPLREVAPNGRALSFDSSQVVPGLVAAAGELEAGGVAFQPRVDPHGGIEALRGPLRAEVGPHACLHLALSGWGAPGEIEVESDLGLAVLPVPDGLAPLAVEQRHGGWLQEAQPARVERSPIVTLLARTGPDGARLPYRFVTVFHLRVSVAGAVRVAARAGVEVFAATVEEDAPPVLLGCASLVDADLG